MEISQVCESFSKVIVLSLIHVSHLTFVTENISVQQFLSLPIFSTKTSPVKLNSPENHIFIIDASDIQKACI